MTSACFPRQVLFTQNGWNNLLNYSIKKHCFLNEVNYNVASLTFCNFKRNITQQFTKNYNSNFNRLNRKLMHCQRFYKLT